jgi:hypothetical protein
MGNGFQLIALRGYVELYVRSNRGAHRKGDVTRRLKCAIKAYREGVRCRCGEPIWIIGSAEVGLGCFTCITGEVVPDADYEIDLTRGLGESRAWGRS